MTRHTGSVLALGVFTAVAVWAGDDGQDEPIPRGSPDGDLEFARSADPDLRSLSAVLGDESAMSTLSSLQRRYELRHVRVHDPSADDPSLCSSGPPGLGIDLCHDFFFKLPASPSDVHLRVRFGACVTRDGGFVVDELSRTRVALQPVDDRALRWPVCESVAELQSLPGVFAHPRVYEELRAPLQSGVATDVAIRETTSAAPDADIPSFQVRVWMLLDNPPADELHTFDVIDDGESGGVLRVVDYRVQ